MTALSTTVVKTCMKCEQELDESMFHADRTRDDGLHPYCIPCRKNIYKGKWSTESRVEYNRKFGYFRDNPEQLKRAVEYLERQINHCIF